MSAISSEQALLRVWYSEYGTFCRENVVLALQTKIKPSKLEVAPNALKMLDGVGEWMDGYPLDCY